MLMSVGVKTPTDRSQSDCVHEQVAKADCDVRFTPSMGIEGKENYSEMDENVTNTEETVHEKKTDKRVKLSGVVCRWQRISWIWQNNTSR